MRSDFKGLAGWIKNSFIDFPGTVSTVLFFSGCNLRCPYCHNPSFILSESDLSDKSEEIWEYLKKRRKIIDGVVISGGEPTLHPGITGLIKEIRSLGYKIKIDSNGLLPEVINEFSPDYLAIDYKTVPELYKKYLGAPFNDVATRLNKSLALVKKMGTNAEVRITVAPKIITREIIQNMLPLLEGVQLVYLQAADMKKEILDRSFFKDTNTITQSEMKEFQSMIMPLVGSCLIRDE